METKRKVRVYKVGNYWYANMPTGKGEGFDIETMVVGMGDTPEQAYNEWQRLAGMARSCKVEKEYVLTWEWLFIIPLAVVVLVWIFG